MNRSSWCACWMRALHGTAVPHCIPARAQEMLEQRELDTARALLRQSAPLAALKIDDPERYLKLEHLLSRPYFEAREAWPAAGGRAARRVALAAALAAEVSVVPSGRLLALLGQALKWQRHTGLLPPGAAFDLFRGAAPARRDEVEAHPASALVFALCNCCCVSRATPRDSRGQVHPLWQEVARRSRSVHARWRGASNYVCGAAAAH